MTCGGSLPRSAITLGGALTVFVLVIALAATGSAAAVVPAPSPGATVVGLARRDWSWPFAAFRLERRYEAPATRFGAGHRGIDLRPLDGFEVRAPAAGVVAFSGSVAGRGILTIDHGDGLVTTLEPIDSTLTAGDRVERGALVGTMSVGGHASSGALHVGVRLRGEYINPLLLLGGVPRAVLLPCC
jgi:murein DD-endopeptidase MepM/ murein hydrolase activator NlpD